MQKSTSILIADDQPHILVTLQYLVNSIGNVQCHSADNGKDAVALAVEHRPTLCMLDVMMPEIDGYQACRMIRDAWDSEHQGEIWFVTARGSKDDLNRANEVGANDLIQKPFDVPELIQRIRAVVEKQHQSAA